VVKQLIPKHLSIPLNSTVVAGPNAHSKLITKLFVLKQVTSHKSYLIFEQQHLPTHYQISLHTSRVAIHSVKCDPRLLFVSKFYFL